MSAVFHVFTLSQPVLDEDYEAVAFLMLLVTFVLTNEPHFSELFKNVMKEKTQCLIIIYDVRYSLKFAHFVANV